MAKRILHKLFGSLAGGEENLLDWRQQFEAIFSNLPVGVAYLTPDMRYIRLNPFLEKRLGRTSEELKGLHCYDTVGMYKDDPVRKGEERICDVCGVRNALRGGMPFKFTRRVSDEFVVENMGVPLKDKSGKVIGAVEIIVDITDRVGMEERLQEYAAELEGAVEEKTKELRRSKRFLKNIIESTADAIFTLDSAGRICYLNSAAEDILGHRKGKLFGMAFTDIVAGQDKERVARALRLSGEKSETFHNLKVTVLAQDGAEKHQLMSLSPLSDDEDKNRFVAICKDVTKEKTLEQEKEEFITMLTHDLKTPLTSIIGYSSLILNGEVGQIGGDVKTSVEAIQVNSQRLLGLVKNFLSAGKIDKNMLKLEPKPIRLEPLVLESIRNMEPQIKDKGLTTETRFDQGMPRVAADREHMERVVCNLIANSIKFTPSGGKIAVSAYHSGSGYVTLEISDTGMGIPEEELPMLFDKYYQGKGSSTVKGTGLGLYIAKNIIEAHRGKITVSSMKDKGTTFTILLPKMV